SNMRRKLWVPFDCWKLPWTSSFIRNRIGIADAECEVRIVVVEEGRHVIVENEKQNIRLLHRKPLANGFIALENRRPVGIGLFICIERESNCWCMRTGD